jgi:hypothetical protein
VIFGCSRRVKVSMKPFTMPRPGTRSARIG